MAHKILPSRLRGVIGRALEGKTIPISSDCQILKETCKVETLQGWQDSQVAKRQHKTFIPLLRQMHEGVPRKDFVALANAVRMTGVQNPSILEVGCGSGWNSEVLRCLLKQPVHYIGLDYSQAMVALGKRCYPQVPFIVGDAAALPLQDRSCAILISGGVLMHLWGYEKAIQESRRVTRRWCIFHTIPVVQRRPTAKLKKYAYGSPVVEIVFNEKEFLELVKDNGFIIHSIFENIPHSYLNNILNEEVPSRTYLCRIA